MKENDTYKQIVLSVYISCRGIGFILFESPLAPYDWGVKDIYGEDAGKRTVKAVVRLMKQYQPEQVVLEDTRSSNTRRGVRAKLLNEQIIRKLASRGIQAQLVSRDEVRTAFARTGAQTKEEIAAVIASKIDLLTPLLPPPRKVWDSEHRRMALFNAASMALAYYVNS